MSQSALILAEGYKLLPRLIAPLLSHARQTVWLLPTPEWRRTALARRGSLWEIAGRTSNPEAALANLLARDALFTTEISRQATSLRLPTIKVDGSIAIDEMLTRAARSLGISEW